jgi:quinol monooxygenase YgiN
MNLTLIVHLKARPGKEQELEATLRGLVAPTRQEAGCINYDLFQDNASPGEFALYENWAAVPEWEAHMKTPHLVDFVARVDDLAETWTLQKLTQIA